MDGDEFARLFFAHAARLVRLAGFLGASDPEDVVQEVCCKVLGGRARLRGEESDAARYLTRSVVNEVRAAVAALPPRQREAVVLRFWLDLSYEEVAAAMGVRTGTAKSQVSRALEALRSWSAEIDDERGAP